MTTGRRFLCTNARSRRKQAFLLQKLSTTQERICKAPCAWRVPPPPAGAVPRYYPYAKVISSARSDLRAACAPPHAGQVPAITRMQKLSTVRETHCRALFRGFRVYISIDKGQYCPRTTPSGWTTGHSLLVLLQSWHLPAAR